MYYYEILLLVGACLQVKSVKTIINLTFDRYHYVLILGCTYCAPLTAPLILKLMQTILTPTRFALTNQQKIAFLL